MEITDDSFSVEIAGSGMKTVKLQTHGTPRQDPLLFANGPPKMAFFRARTQLRPTETKPMCQSISVYRLKTIQVS